MGQTLGHRYSSIDKLLIDPDAMSVAGSIDIAYRVFKKGHEKELSLREGDLLNLRIRSKDWRKTKKTDKKGRSRVILSECLNRPENLEEQLWFFGTMDRFEAESHLRSPENKNGTFLIRSSDRDSARYVLSVRSSTQVKHFKILQDKDKKYHIESSPQFSFLVNLVEHYKTNSLREVGKLREPCKRTEIPEIIVDIPMICKEEFVLEEKLGSGVFADVYKGHWKNNINVAIKVIKCDLELNHPEILRDRHNLLNFRHRHLLPLFAVCAESEPYYLVTELMEKGSLLEFLRGPEGKLQDTVTLVDMGAQVANGMAFLEKKNILHRELAAQNVLVGEGCICKVYNFGLTRIKEPNFTDENQIPFKWTAPEAISNGKFSNKSDVWSFGVLLYEIITFGGIPYPEFSDKEVYEKVTCGYRMPCPPKCPGLLYDTMLDCWRPDPDDRPTFKTLVRHLDVTSYS